MPQARRWKDLRKGGPKRLPEPAMALPRDGMTPVRQSNQIFEVFGFGVFGELLFGFEALGESLGGTPLGLVPTFAAD